MFRCAVRSYQRAGEQERFDGPDHACAGRGRRTGAGRPAHDGRKRL